MQFRLHAPRLTFSQQHKIYDEKDRLAYHAKAKWFRYGVESVIYAPNGNEVASIRQRGFFGCRFDVIVNGSTLGTISRKLSLLRSYYVLNHYCGEALHFIGRWRGFEVNYGDSTVATTRSRFSLLQPAYDISISKGEKPLPVLAALIGIDIYGRTQHG